MDDSDRQMKLVAADEAPWKISGQEDEVIETSKPARHAQHGYDVDIWGSYIFEEWSN